jgi:hypothetical protein
MANITHTITSTISSNSQSASLSGFDQETGGNSEILINQSYSAATTNGALTLAFTQANVQDVFIVSTVNATLTTNGTGTADVQTVSISGTPTGGFFPLTFKGQTTVVAYNATSGAIQTALQALSTIGASNVTCSGGPLPGTPVVCTFAGGLATGLQPLMTTYSGQLTGGVSPTASVAHTTPGLPQDTIALIAGIPLVWGKSAGYTANPFAGNVTQAYITCTPAAQIQGRVLTS